MAGKQHHKSNTSEYHAWEAMLSRCRNKNNPRYKDYGGRGISFDPSWADFTSFYRDMGDKPNKNYSLDRLDNDGNYTKENCSWRSQEKQMRNTRFSNKKEAGISLYPTGKYRAIIWVKNKKIHIGMFDSFDLAYQAREKAKQFYWGA